MVLATTTATSSLTRNDWLLDLSETSTRPSQSLKVLNRATNAKNARNFIWHSGRSVTLILNLPGVGSVQASWLASLVSKVIEIGSQDADLSSLELHDARISRTLRGDLMVEASAGSNISVEDQPAKLTVELKVSRRRSKSRSPRSTHVHSRLAAELREMTGLPAASLASAFGVSREQYQRWLSGSAISSIRHGQLTYAHTIAAEVVRKLGQPEAITWWRTPQADGVAPDEILRQRNLAEVYRLVAELRDPQPIVGNSILGLLVQDDDEDEEPPEGIEEQGAWSPYGQHSGGASSG